MGEKAREEHRRYAGALDNEESCVLQEQGNLFENRSRGEPGRKVQE